MSSIVTSLYIVPGHPHILLAQEKNQGWGKLHSAYDRVRQEIEESDAEMILYFSTQWLSVLGYMFQGDPNPNWHLVDPNFHELGTMHYSFKVDTEFSETYAECVKPLGHNTRVVNYEGFPIDTGTVVANKLLNPDNRLKVSMVSCNMYAEKEEMIRIGQAASQAIANSGKKVAVVLVSSFSNRYFVEDIDPKDDCISSKKDDEWNQKILEILASGQLEDVSQLARDFSLQANADMGFKGVWWLAGLTGCHNNFRGQVFEYQPVWGTGASLVGLYPTENIVSSPFTFDSEEGSQANLVASMNQEKLRENVDSKDIDQKPSYVKKVKHQDSLQSEKAPEPVGAYPHSRRVGDLLFISGMGPRKRGTKEIPGVTLDSNRKIIAYDIEKQTHSVMENIKCVLEESGSSMDKVVDVQVFLTNMKSDFKQFNSVYAEYFNAESGPTRTTVEVGSLPTPIAVELKVIARP